MGRSNRPWKRTRNMRRVCDHERHRCDLLHVGAAHALAAAATLTLEQRTEVRLLDIFGLEAGRVRVGDVPGKHLLTLGEPAHLVHQPLEQRDFAKIHDNPAFFGRACTLA